jgi:hypothetical protein
MGFNATRRYRDDKDNDIRLLVIGIVVVVGLILWAVGVF